MKILHFITTLLVASAAFASHNITPTSAKWLQDKATVEKRADSYLFKTSMFLKDNYPANRERKVQTSYDYPRLHSGSTLFDGVYALSVDEMIQNSVEVIRDHSFEQSPCHCFETGKKWNYVWTRDIAYASHLSLAMLNQKRTLNSLNFKLSTMSGKGFDTLEIVQDTGTGGSWPISSDRVIWSLAAQELLYNLTGAEKEEFKLRAYTALKNTVNNDRVAIFDQEDGLYTGEQSFLDWREQSYPGWSAKNTIHVGMSKTLSTNAAHYKALDLLAELAMSYGRVDEYKLYSKWANNLKTAINKEFWDEEKGLYRTYKLTFLDQNDVDKYDLLGLSLVILMDIAQTDRQKKSLQYYPSVKAGPPVMWPQDQAAPIYHNRGIWPFVTTYGLLAAKKEKLAKTYNHYFESLIAGTTLNLSNMENFEFLSMKNWYDAGYQSGPVVNSQRQLWSVAGMLSAYIKGIFGIEINDRGITFTPFVTERIRNSVLKNVNELTLSDFKFQGKTIDVILRLPKVSKSTRKDSFYNVSAIMRNGRSTTKTLSRVNEGDVITIYLDDIQTSIQKNIVYPYTNPNGLSSIAFETLFAPETPTLFPIKSEKGLPKLYFQFNSYRDVTFSIYKNNELLDDNLTSGEYLDRSYQGGTTCYVVATTFTSTNNKSLHSEPHCYWATDAIQKYDVASYNVDTIGTREFVADHGKVYLRNWGDTKDTIRFNHIIPNYSGRYALQMNYNNLGHINTGITAAVKMVEVYDEYDNLVEQGVFMMPHHERERYWIDSNFVTVELKQGQHYSVVLKDFYNMSYFEHFRTYFYRGGRNGLYNKVNIAELKLLYLPQ